MAEEQKLTEVKEVTPVEVPAETKPADEAKPAEAVAETEAPATAVETEAPVEENTELTEEPKDEEAKEEVKPIEEGSLDHRGVGFPHNLVYKKEFFWFGTDAVESKALAAYLKHEKSSEAAQQNVAWAAHTGKGLLFVGDKAAPNFVYNLSEISEPVNDGANKFVFTIKGHKHTFKTASTVDRDNWVAQIKTKIVEAKELATSIAETEEYKTALESLKPAKKEEKKAEEDKEEEASKEETASAAEDKPAEEGALKEESAAVPATEGSAKETKDEEAKEEEPKRRSVSRKRTSILGFLNKREKKTEEKTEEAVVDVPEADGAKEANDGEAPKEEATPASEDKPVEESHTEEKAEAKESLKEKTKRNSIFGFSFKKEKKVVEEKVAEAEDITTAPSTAPVIPPVATTAPLGVEATAEATAPAAEEKPAEVKEVAKEKTEKRKSTLPFGLGKKPTSDDETEKSEKGLFAFGKLRATIRGRKPAVEKAEEKPAVPEETTEAAAAETKEEPVEAVKEEPLKIEAEAEETNEKPEVVPAAPVVTTAA